MKLKIEHLGSLLFLLGWIFIGLHVAQPFYLGKQILKTAPQNKDAQPIVKYPGGEPFAYHQKQKTGDIPAILPLTINPDSGAAVVLTKNWLYQFDMRWSPGLMEYDGKEFRYAQGERPPTRRNRSGQSTRRVLSLGDFGGDYEERIYDLQAGKIYFLLLPQNSAWQKTAYSVTLRQRKSDQDIFYLMLGLLCLGSGVLILASQAKKTSRHMDGVEAAKVYAKWGRTEQAKQMLLEARRKQPHRKQEIDALIAGINQTRI